MSEEMPEEIVEALENTLADSASDLYSGTTFRGVLDDGRVWKAKILDVQFATFDWTWESWEVSS